MGRKLDLEAVKASIEIVGDNDTVYLRVGKFDVRVKHEDEGIVVDVYPYDEAYHGDSIATMSVFDSDADEALGVEPEPGAAFSVPASEHRSYVLEFGGDVPKNIPGESAERTQLIEDALDAFRDLEQAEDEEQQRDFLRDYNAALAKIREYDAK